MRYLVAAALFLSPVMVNAQTASSAQNPQLAAMHPTSAATNMMMSSASASAASASAADRSQAIDAKPRVSTGVVPPKLIHTVTIHQDTASLESLGRTQRAASVSMIVDEEGKPTDLKITKSAGPDLDANILEAVSQYRFLPATVSGQKIAMELNLHLDIQVNP